MTTVILIIVCALIVLFGGFAFYLAGEEKRQRKQIEKEIQEAKENEQRKAEANKTKADARTGDHERDLNYMANRLHEYANR